MYIQKVKHLEYDHQNTINAINMEMALLQEEETNDHEMRKEKLKMQRKALKERPSHF